MADYFYLTEQNEQKGPMAAEDLIKNGVTKNTMVWKEGMLQWKPAKDVIELKDLLHSQSQPIQPPTLKKPNSFLIWSIITILLCWPLGILAIIYSLKVDSWWKAGMAKEAYKASKRAKICCLLCLAFYVITILIGLSMSLIESNSFTMNI